MAKLPCQWLYLGGFTFRWGRGDSAIDVLRGDTGPVHENHQLVVSIPVDHSWDDIRDLDQKARAWLHATAAQRAATSWRKSR
ncbi:hypothetical protein SAMN05216215_103816 [Saccharopolyspora shandongensis]|uniref:Uncharacterized protein n=1 Tax=Saccharopolyspora shandongensis TaxID=418495 RepID=A0A1H3NK10_9PSEU|nr:hypothetical protein [Saccharopolyspora shandongensis]SDY88775.1 hypothetical protein SAMN05216215_103816 [Saccharopolyspora shandongensis]